MAKRQPQYYHHGRSTMAWIGSGVASVGFIAAAIGAVLGPNWIVVGAGAALVLLAGIFVVIAKAMGYGQP